MFDLRQRLLIGIGIAGGVLIAVVLLIMNFTGKPEAGNLSDAETPAEDTAETDNRIENSRASPVTGVLEPEAPRAPADPSDTNIRQTARAFVERFATYSNQNGNAHIDDVLPLASASMARWIESQRVSASSTYEGVTTRVVTSKITNKTDAAATVRVETQQVKNGKTSYRSGRVELVNENGVWKVSGLYWE